MKRIGIFLALGLLAVAINAHPVSAVIAFRSQFLKTYKDAEFYDAAKEAKCNVCHVGKDKKKRNDYGQALRKHVTKKDYTELRKDKEALKKKIEAAFNAVLKEKSVSGKTFGELMKEGKLPGTVPPDAAE